MSEDLNQTGQAAPELDIDPFSAENLENPQPMHEQLREAGPVVKLRLYDIFAVARHDEVHAVLNDWETFISSAGVGLANFNKETPFRPQSLVLEADPPNHTRARAVLARILSPKSMMQMKATFQKEADDLLDQLMEKASAGPVDGVTELAERYPLKVFPDAVGVAAENRENLLAYGNMIFNSFGPRNDLLEKSARQVAPITEWIMGHCERSALRPGGFGDLIYQAADTGEISHEEAPLLVRSFLSAGVDTTVNGLGNALHALASHPEQYARLHADPALARPAFEEALRFDSTVQTFFRTTSRDCMLAGVAIPKDSKVLTFLASANRDPRKWPEADRYDITRRPAGHMAFGSGIHGCVGQAVARLEGEMILGGLARRARRLTLAGKPTRRLNNTLHAMASLPLTITAA